MKSPLPILWTQKKQKPLRKPQKAGKKKKRIQGKARTHLLVAQEVNFGNYNA